MHSPLRARLRLGSPCMAPPHLAFKPTLSRHPAGSRLTSIFMAGIVAPLPLLLHMAVSMFEMMSVRSNPALCASPLLTHPLTAARIRRAHGAMQALSQPCEWVAGRGARRGRASACTCAGAACAATTLD